MVFKIISCLLFFSFIKTSVAGQTENYIVKKASFSTDRFDEFSPVYYKKGIVFCSNQDPVLPFNYSTNDNKNFFKIHFIDTTNINQKPSFFSGSLNSHFNDGPVSFNSSGDTIYFSRNLVGYARPRSASDPRNTLGIFFAVFAGNKWRNITDLRFNSDSYNVTTPWLSPDGKKLYFASDKPGGYGGSDLYFCEWRNNYWNNPVNLGNVINTEGNEAYPFVNRSGELFFSSDGHAALGGKDIFYSKYNDSAWIEPVRLNPPINSEYDDFGFIADEDMNNGYFTSRRSETLDIYKFKTINPQFFYCSDQKTNVYCFSFQDDIKIDIDPVNLQFTWDFGDGKSGAGYMIDHCFPGPGKYVVKQNIAERKTGRLIFNKMTYDLELKEVDQAYISASDKNPAGKELVLDGSRTHLPGHEIISYLWDFGDGNSLTGESVKHVFKENGEYNIKLGILAKEIATGINRKICVSKKITVGGKTAVADNKGDKNKVQGTLPPVTDYDNAVITYRYSSSKALSEKAIFQVELLTSATKIKINDNNSVFSKLDPKYTVREIFLNDEKLFSYVTDEGINFMDVYPAFKDISTSDFKNARIKTYISSDPAERELWNIKRLYGTSADIFFEKNDFRIRSGDYPVLDQIVILMKKNPSLKIEIASHTDNSDLSEMTNQKLSQSRAQSILNYFADKGISRNRLKPAGYGSTRPIAPNYSEADRKKNRRIDFILISN